MPHFGMEGVGKGSCAKYVVKTNFKNPDKLLSILQQMLKLLTS
jgi:hypothetical protein